MSLTVVRWNGIIDVYVQPYTTAVGNEFFLWMKISIITVLLLDYFEDYLDYYSLESMNTDFSFHTRFRTKHLIPSATLRRFINSKASRRSCIIMPPKRQQLADLHLKHEREEHYEPQNQTSNEH
ncbi:hypothetical protein TNCV_3214311 [Trichonephila clavipes]|nr:hypothetical protein TNCV_3214311 [Trichonephila clavipes]